MDDAIARGADDPPLREDTIGQALDEAARRWPDQEAVVSVHQAVRWTYRDLNTRASAFAAGLLALGLEPGDRIGTWSPNRAEWTLTQFAAARAGLILVHINPAYRLSEVEYTLNKVGVKALVAAESFKTSHYADMIDSLAPEIAASRPGQIAHYKIPRYVRFVDAFPMTVTGKVQKFLIRDQMIAELNLTVAQTA